MKYALAFLTVAFPVLAATVEDAIRTDDLQALRALSTPTVPPRALHYAAAYGSAAAVRLLIAAGADVNAQDAAGTTPLLLAATSFEKTSALLKAGANPNIASRMGRTPLHVAAAMHDGTRTVRALLDRGAVIEAASERGETPLMDAAAYGPVETIKLLLSRGASARTRSKIGVDALWWSTNYGDPQRIRLLLAAGADPNCSNTFAGKVRKGDIALVHMTPLLLTATHGPQESVRALLAAGAKWDVKDGRGVTPFDAARSADGPNAEETARLLAAAGAMPGSAAQPATASVKRRSTPLDPAEAIEKGLLQLQKSNTEFFKESGCVGCHHQPVTALAFRRIRGENSVAAEEMKRGLSATRPMEPLLTQMVDTGGDMDSVSWLLVGADAAGAPPDSLTSAAVRYLLARQRPDGSWRNHGIARPPFEEGNIGRTVNSVRAIQAYGWPAIQNQTDAAVKRTRLWLEKVEARHNYERAELLLGLAWTKASQAKLRTTAEALLREQTPAGGWSQTSRHEPDAYATALALHALHQSGMLTADDPRYRRGAEWLLRDQAEDGTWYVASRAPKFQPYFESGFPYGHDQWISVPATAYAAMALAPLTRAANR